MIGQPRKAAAFFALVLSLCAASPAFAARSETGTLRLMEGPMVGPVTPTSIAIWVRTSDTFPVAVEYSTSPDMTDPMRTEPIMPTAGDDFAGVVRMTNLEPDTAYYYRVLANDRPAPRLRGNWPMEIQTAPAGSADFTVAFGSCARVQEDPVQPIWNVVNQLDPDLFFWVGDNIYGDSHQASTLAEEYRRQRFVPSLQPVNWRVPQLAVWDDHDYGLNDHDRTNPVKEQTLAVFKKYWPNPGYGTEEAPGVYFSYSYGGVDFVFVDCRYYRDPNTQPDGPDKTFLGEAQLAWLKEQLKASDAPFKVLVSGSGWTNAKGPGGDSWASALHERDALFDWIRDNEINGVVLMSGDTHTGECNAIPWSENGGYDFYDLVSSPLAQDGSSGWRNRNPEARLRPGFERANVGLIEFEMAQGDPQLTFHLYDEEGTPAWEPLVVRASDLRNGVTSYKENDHYEE